MALAVRDAALFASVVCSLAACGGSSSPTQTLPVANLASASDPANGAASAVAAAPVYSSAPLLSTTSRRLAYARVIESTGSSVFSDNFEEDTVNRPAPNWTVVNGSWHVCQPPHETHAYCGYDRYGAASLAGQSWTNYHVDAVVESTDLSHGGVALLARVQDAMHYYQLELRSDVNGSGRIMWYIWKFDGTWRQLAGGPLGTVTGPWFSLRFDINGDTLSAYVAKNGTNYQSLGSGSDSTYRSGFFGLRAWGSPGLFDLVSVTLDGGSTTNLPTQEAQSAGAFVRRTGVNMHNTYYGTPYTANVPLVESLVENLGISIVRDGMALGQYNVCSEDADLAKHGIHFEVVVDASFGPNDPSSWASCIGTNAVASFEGPNEYDLAHGSDRNWPATLRSVQSRLFSTIRSRLPGVAVVGPAVSTEAAAEAVGDLSAVTDDGNAHVYYSGHNPGNSGYGNASYGSIAATLALLHPINGARPIVVTETGYGTAGGTGQVDETTQAKYVTRNLLELSNAGAAAMIDYELIDEAGPPFSRYGLLRGDLSPKPSYLALKSLLHLLSDGGSSGAQLAYQLSGNTGNVHHALFAKSDGTFLLALWLEVSSADPNTGLPLAVPPQQVALTLDHQAAPQLYSYDGNWNLVATSLPAAVTIPLTVTDRVAFVAFR